MKLITLILTVLGLHVATRAAAQTISYEGKNVTMKTVFNEIKKQTHYFVVYNVAEVEISRKVNVQATNEPLEKFLVRFLNEQGLKYRVEANTIVVSPKEKNTKFLPVTLDTAQRLVARAIPNIVHGSVKDEHGRPLEAVTVLIKGKRTGTITNAGGSFSLAGDKGDVLAFSYLNFAPQEIKVGKGDMLVQMKLDMKPLEELVVGSNYVVTERKTEVSSVTVIDSKTLEKLPNQGIEQIFRGLVPGVNSIQPSSGEVSQINYRSGVVSIRGSGGFGGIGIVKVFVDGIEFAGGSYWLNTIDKYSIDRIEVIKGPSAATLYGSGANGGVIMVYTKKGVANRTSINLSTSAGWWDSKWQSKKPFQNIHSFDISQGFKNVSYIIGGNINNSESYMPGGNMNRYAVYGSVALNVSSKLKLTLDGRHFVNNFTPNRNAFYDDSTDAFYNRPGWQKPDTTHGTISTNTIGLSAHYQATDRWGHNVVLGWSDNEYSRNTNLTNPPLRGSSQVDKSPTIRYNNTIAMGRATADFKTSLLTGLDYFHYQTSALSQLNGRAVNTTTSSQENTGIFGQLNPSYKNKCFLTAALRYDINPNFTPTLSPKIGFTTNFKIKSFTLRPRVSWGKGITPADPGMRYPEPSSSATFVYLPNPRLKPQKQEGWDYAVEGFSGNKKLKFEIVRYDNALTDAFYNNITFSADTTFSQYINAGKIANRGWELSVDYTLRNFNLAANYSITKSVLKEPLAGTFSPKDYPQPGEQMMFIPEYTGGLTLNYNLPKLFGKTDRLLLSIAAIYTSGIYSLDYTKYVYDLGVKGNTNVYRDMGMRGYVIQYPSSAKFNFDLEYNIIPELKFFTQVRNIGNNTTPEYLNNQPSVGRGWLFGLKYSFSKMEI
jgi:outer membrane receptor protein involved in Fe transport